VRHDVLHATPHFCSHVDVAGIVWHWFSHEFSHVVRQRQLQPTEFGLAEHSAPHDAEHRFSHTFAQTVCAGCVRHCCVHSVPQLVVHSCFGTA
jgi:hypothetical protein